MYMRDVGPTEGRDVGSAQARLFEPDVGRTEGVVGGDRGTGDRGGARSRGVVDRGPRLGDVLGDLVDGDGGVVADHVGLDRVDLDERLATQLGGGDGHVAVLGEGD